MAVKFVREKLLDAGLNCYKYEFPREDLKSVLEAIKDVYGNKVTEICIRNKDTDYDNHDYRYYPDMNAFIEDCDSLDEEMEEHVSIDFVDYHSHNSPKLSDSLGIGVHKKELTLSSYFDNTYEEKAANLKNKLLNI